MSEYKRQNKYNQKMENLGFIRPKVWVHEDDWEHLKQYAEKLRLKKIKQLKVNTQTAQK